MCTVVTVDTLQCASCFGGGCGAMCSKFTNGTHSGLAILADNSTVGDTAGGFKPHWPHPQQVPVIQLDLVFFFFYVNWTLPRKQFVADEVRNMLLRGIRDFGVVSFINHIGELCAVIAVLTSTSCS